MEFKYPKLQVTLVVITGINRIIMEFKSLSTVQDGVLYINELIES